MSINPLLITKTSHNQTDAITKTNPKNQNRPDKTLTDNPTEHRTQEHRNQYFRKYDNLVVHMTFSRIKLLILFGKLILSNFIPIFEELDKKLNLYIIK